MAVESVQQHGDVKRLRDVIRGPCDSPFDLVEDAVFAGKHQDWHVLQVLVTLDDLANFIAVHLRHRDVEKHQTWRVLSKSDQSLHAVFGRYHTVPLTLQR